MAKFKGFRTEEAHGRKAGLMQEAPWSRLWRCHSNAGEAKWGCPWEASGAGWEDTFVLPNPPAVAIVLSPVCVCSL